MFFSVFLFFFFPPKPANCKNDSSEFDKALIIMDTQWSKKQKLSTLADFTFRVINPNLHKIKTLHPNL